MQSILTMIRNLIKRGYVSRSLADTGAYNIVQVSYLGSTGNAEVINPYGLYSRLPEDIQVLIWSVQGHENNRACIGYSQKYRFKNLEKGEVMFGNPMALSSIKFDKDGNIIVTSPGNVTVNSQGKVTVNAANDVEITSSSGAINMTATTGGVNLGAGGSSIARVGDTIKVNVGGTDYFGTIETGGTNTST